MSTIRIFASFLLALTASTALPESVNKQVTQIAGSNLCWGLKYSEEGFITDVVDNSEKGPELLWSYEYNEGSRYILQYGYFGADYQRFTDQPFYRTSTLNSDNLISKDKNENNYMWSTGEDFEYEYSDGRMVKMTGNEGIVIELSWTDGNLAQIVFLERGEEEGRISCSYTDIPAKGICQTFNSPLIFLLSYYTMQSVGPLAHGYYGLLSQNLLSEITISFSEKFMEEHYTDYEQTTIGYPVTNKKSRKYSYESDSGGNITTIMVNEEGRDLTYNLKYGYTDKKCCAPTIVYNKGTLSFHCETPNADYLYNIKSIDFNHGFRPNYDNHISLSQTYKIRVQATLDGWQDSDVAVATISWRNGRPVMEGFSSVTLNDDGNCDVNGDGTIDVADIATIIDSMAGK